MSHTYTFGEPTLLLELFRQASLDQEFGFDEETPFLVEAAFLSNWNRDLQDLPAEEGLKEMEAYSLPCKDPGEICAHIWMVYQDDEYFDELYFTYSTFTDGRCRPGQYALSITQNDNLVYARTIDQDPATEWQINIMAGDPEITDETGEMLFDGEPVNV